VGGFTSFNGTSRNGVCRLNSDGSLDTSFNPGTGISSVLAQPMYAVRQLSTGKILIGGSFYEYNGNTAYGAVRLNSDGSYDSGFEFKITTNDYVSDIRETSGGKYIFVGTFANYDSGTADGIIMTNTDGTVYTSFAVGTGFDTSTAYSVLNLSNGQFFVGGDFNTYNGTSVGENVVLLNSDGTAVDTCAYFVTIDTYTPTSMTCQSNYSFAAATSGATNVDTNVDVEISWYGDLGGLLTTTVTILQGTSCIIDVSVGSGSNINCLGEFLSNVSVILNPSAYGSQIYQVGNNYDVSSAPC
jgi:hypothetical protein